MKSKKNQKPNQAWIKDSLVQLEKLKQDHKLIQKQLKQDHKKKKKAIKKKYEDLRILESKKLNLNFKKRIVDKHSKKIIAKNLKSDYLNNYENLKLKIKNLKKQAKHSKANKKEILTNIDLILNKIKCLKLEYKLNYAKKFSKPTKTNKKIAIQNKNLQKQEIKLIVNEFKSNFEATIKKQRNATKKLKSQIKNEQNVLVVNKKKPTQDYSVDLLKEKLKNQAQKKQKEQLPEFQQGFLKTFRQMPLRLFKEFKRVNWIQSNINIFKKFFWVCLMIALIALFIFGAETFIVWLVKILHISKF